MGGAGLDEEVVPLDGGGASLPYWLVQSKRKIDSKRHVN